MNEQQDKTETTRPLKPSKTVALLFERAVVKIKAKAEKEVAEQKARLEAEIASANTRVVAETEETSEGSEIEQKGESQDKLQTSKEKIETSLEDELEEKAEAQEHVIEQKVESNSEMQAAARQQEVPSETESIDEITTEESKVESESEETEQKTKSVDTNTPENVTQKKEERIAEAKESEVVEVSEATQQTTPLQTNNPEEPSPLSFGACAEDVMIKELVWASPEDSVQQALTKMEQQKNGYLLIGRDGVLEGLLSKSDLAGAISPYLRPEFAKWRRPTDDATLQIKVKWIMSRLVHTIEPKTPVVKAMENMYRLQMLCLPVVDQQGKVQGLVTDADILKALNELKSTSKTLVSSNSNEHQNKPVSNQNEQTASSQTTKSDLIEASG